MVTSSAGYYRAESSYFIIHQIKRRATAHWVALFSFSLPSLRGLRVALLNLVADDERVAPIALA